MLSDVFVVFISEELGPPALCRRGIEDSYRRWNHLCELFAIAWFFFDEFGSVGKGENVFLRFVWKTQGLD